MLKERRIKTAAIFLARNGIFKATTRSPDALHQKQIRPDDVSNKTTTGSGGIMSRQLRKYLHDAYTANPYLQDKRHAKDLYYQIDDQNEYDHIVGFVNIFARVPGKNTVEIELRGDFPQTAEIISTVKSRGGSIDWTVRAVKFRIDAADPSFIAEFSELLRQSVPRGSESWRKNSARTISSLARFARIIKGFNPA